MEFDVRNLDDNKITGIRFSDTSVLTCLSDTGCLLVDGDGDRVMINMKEVDDLIKALNKYKEVYG